MIDELIESLAVENFAKVVDRVERLEVNDYFTPIATEAPLSTVPTNAEIENAFGTPESHHGNVVGLIRDRPNRRYAIVFGDTNDWYYTNVDLAT
jgi:hypothetical protein